MPKQSRKFTLILGLALVLALVALASAMAEAEAEAPASQALADARHEGQISATLALSPYLRANDLQATVHAGRATLTGEVAEGAEKELAKQIALGVWGVSEVDNQIIVRPDYVRPVQSKERSFGEVIDDATATAAISSKLTWSQHAQGLAVVVDTQRGQVTLRGTARSTQAVDLAGRLAANTRGVVSVDNQLQVSPAVPVVTSAAAAPVVVLASAVSAVVPAAAVPVVVSAAVVPAEAPVTKVPGLEATDVVSDDWITRRVMSSFRYSSKIDTSEIKVSTTAGIVTLSGSLDSEVQRALAIELAENVRGVASVEASTLTN